MHAQKISLLSNQTKISRGMLIHRWIYLKNSASPNLLGVSHFQLRSLKFFGPRRQRIPQCLGPQGVLTSRCILVMYVGVCLYTYIFIFLFIRIYNYTILLKYTCLYAFQITCVAIDDCVCVLMVYFVTCTPVLITSPFHIQLGILPMKVCYALVANPLLSDKSKNQIVSDIPIISSFKIMIISPLLLLEIYTGLSGTSNVIQWFILPFKPILLALYHGISPGFRHSQATENTQVLRNTTEPRITCSASSALAVSSSVLAEGTAGTTSQVAMADIIRKADAGGLDPKKGWKSDL